jgi:hypothetical protein
MRNKHSNGRSRGAVRPRQPPDIQKIFRVVLRQAQQARQQRARLDEYAARRDEWARRGLAWVAEGKIKAARQASAKAQYWERRRRTLSKKLDPTT